MDWQDGTGGGFQLRREAYHPAFLAHESVSGERWAEGIETAGSRSTGESRRRSVGALPKSSSFPSVVFRGRRSQKGDFAYNCA